MITVEKLKQEFESQYQLLCFVDLAEVSSSVDLIYKIFAKHWKSSYKSNERFIFYSSETPGIALLNHIQQAAFDVDISACFITIACPTDCKSYFESTSTDSMQNVIVNIVSTKPLQDNYKAIEKICPLPWMHVEVQAQGSVSPCCAYDNQGQHVYKGLEDYFTSDIDNLRKQFICGHTPQGCNNCFATESKGGISNRQRMYKFYKKEFLTEWIDDPKIRSLDLKPGNACNFKCRICGPKSSSMHVIEQLKQNPDDDRRIQLLDYNRKGNWFDDNSALAQEIFNATDNLVNLDLFGGEPFLIKKVSELIKTLVKKGSSKHIRMHLHTNGSIYPENIVNLFTEFKEVDIAISIDNIGDRFELERGGDWNAVEQNVKLLSELKKQGINVYIFTTVNAQNVYYLDELLLWSDSLDLTVLFNHTGQVDGEPDDPWCLRRLTPHAQKTIIRKFSNHKDPRLKSLGSMLENIQVSNSNCFVQAVERFDSIRKEKFRKSHKEIANLMGML